MYDFNAEGRYAAIKCCVMKFPLLSELHVFGIYGMLHTGETAYHESGYERLEKFLGSQNSALLYIKFLLPRQRFSASRYVASSV
jgi:hypothetical protein